MVIEGEGGYTVVQGEKCPMEKGDLILTPSGLWHEHGHDGTGPVIWLDALDLPIVLCAGGVLCGGRRAAGGAQRAGFVAVALPPRRPGALSLARRARAPAIRCCAIPWQEVREALIALAEVTPQGRDGAARLRQSGDRARMHAGARASRRSCCARARPSPLPRRSASAVLHVIEGEGEVEVDGMTLDLQRERHVAIPTHAKVLLANRKSQGAGLPVPDRRRAAATQVRLLRSVQLKLTLARLRSAQVATSSVSFAPKPRELSIRTMRLGSKR